MTEKMVVFNTCGSAEEAEKIARMLVGKRLAACVSVVAPVRSFYRWKGAVESAEEWLLIIKTSGECFENLSSALVAAHSYEVPEVIALPIVAGAPAYLKWMDAQSGDAGE